ncbi:MAG: hypothetical protein HN429_04015, partial [Candidatus Magasanikbacteria bacterium]|nr:hypothetical protein [Candidatus Magasanikbacteria bacterium]
IAFNRAMAISTYGNTHEGLVINECANEFCNEEEINDEPVQLDEVLADDPFQYRVRPRGQFQENTWYLARVLPTIRAIEQLEPLRIGSAVTSTSWKFRVKAEDGFCAVDRVRIEPNPFNAIEIGQKTSYKATPHGAPDECSPFGQELDPLAYGWNWSTQNAEVADITHF